MRGERLARRALVCRFRRQQQARFEVGEPGGHHQIVGGELDSQRLGAGDDGVDELDRRRTLHETDGLAEGLAAELAGLEYLDGLLPVAELARVHGLDAALVGEIYYGLAEEIDFAWLQDALARVAGADLWEQRAARALALELEDAGVLGELGGGSSYEVLLLHHRTDMTHEVMYLRYEWNEALQQSIPETRTEHNLDQTNTWGLHLGYVQPLGPDGWRIGGVLTSNRKSHPKIPNYELMNIPRDPGTTWAYNAGLGLARTVQKTTFGVDVLYEPIRSDTWVEAATPIALPDRNKVIEKGEKTLTNDFNFSNTTVRAGVRRDGTWTELQLGLQVHTIRYELDQRDIVADTFREQSESWSEWTASWGGGVKLDDLHIRYQGRVTTGTGRPGIATTALEVRGFAAASDIILAPRGPITLQDANVFTHQLSITIPINTRGSRK